MGSILFYLLRCPAECARRRGKKEQRDGKHGLSRRSAMPLCWPRQTGGLGADDGELLPVRESTIQSQPAGPKANDTVFAFRNHGASGFFWRRTYSLRPHRAARERGATRKRQSMRISLEGESVSG